MRSLLKFAALASIPVETANLWLVGDPSAPHPLTSFSQIPAIALQWDAVHLPAVILIDHSIPLRDHLWLCRLLLFVSGWFVTAVLLLFVFWIIRIALRGIRRLSSPLSRAA
jgi:hypothetical protein